MKTFTWTSLTTALLVSALAAPAANAQDVTATTRPPALTTPAIEVTPFVAIDSRGSIPIGVAVNVPLSPSFGIETEVGYRRAEGRLHALSSSANLLYALPRIGRTTPYLAGGAGLAQYGTPIVARDGSLLGTQPRLAFEVNAGGDLSWSPTRWTCAPTRGGSSRSAGTAQSISACPTASRSIQESADEGLRERSRRRRRQRPDFPISCCDLHLY